MTVRDLLIAIGQHESGKTWKELAATYHTSQTTLIRKTQRLIDEILKATTWRDK